MTTRKRVRKDIQQSSFDGSDYQSILYINPASPNFDFFNHYNNISGNFITNNDYDLLSESIIREVKAKRLCNDILNAKYIKQKMEIDDFILAKVEMSVNSRGEIREKIIGFAVGKLMYIENKPPSSSSSKKQNRNCVMQ